MLETDQRAGGEWCWRRRGPNVGGEHCRGSINAAQSPRFGNTPPTCSVSGTGRRALPMESATGLDDGRSALITSGPCLAASRWTNTLRRASSGTCCADGAPGHLNTNFLGAHTVAVCRMTALRFPLPPAADDGEQRQTRDAHAIRSRGDAHLLGEPGTNGQHSFYQPIHQGNISSCAIHAFGETLNPFGQHHDIPSRTSRPGEALAFGKTEERERRAARLAGPHRRSRETARPTRFCCRAHARRARDARRPYEHIVFTQGVIWNVDLRPVVEQRCLAQRINLSLAVWSRS